MRFLVAPSGFKESLDACAVADAIAAGIHRVVPGAIVDKVPLVDGGEGSAKALAEATGGTLIPALVTGPIGEPVPRFPPRVAPLRISGEANWGTSSENNGSAPPRRVSTS